MESMRPSGSSVRRLDMFVMERTNLLGLWPDNSWRGDYEGLCYSNSGMEAYRVGTRPGGQRLDC